MNSMKLFSLLAVVFFVSVLSVDAQTVTWSIKPAYTNITLFNNGVYKVKNGTKVGLIDETGTVIVPVTTDSITDPVEGYSLLLGFGEEKYRLEGFVGNDKKVIPVPADYYVDQYPFFSDGKLPVCNSKGKYGFINTNGRLIIGFEYATIHPFSEGLAAVSKKNLIGNMTSLINKKNKGSVLYIDENGRPLTLQAEIENISSGTTFKNGEALVTSKNDKQYIINTAGTILREGYDLPLIFDEKYCLVADNAKQNESRQETILYDGPTTFSENGLYGYRLNDKIVLPPQFSEAMPFSKGYAIVKKDGKKGMLKLIKGTFVIQQNKGSLSSTDSEKEAIDYVAEVPDEWKNETLKLYYLDKEEKNSISASLPGSATNSQTFSFLLPADRDEGQVMLEGQNLILYKAKVEDKKKNAASAIEVTVVSETTKANAKDNAIVSVRLKNNSEESYEITVNISGDRLKAVKKTLTLQGNSVERISTSFYKVTKKEKRAMTIETSFRDKISKEIWVVPFFTEL